MRFEEKTLPNWKNCTRDWLDRKIRQIKQECKNKPYDCIIGLSGGVDSSYLLHFMVEEYELRVLAVHVDAGWNTQTANNNIENLVNKLGIPLHTITIDWNEMRDLQVAFLKSGVANCDAPQDHAFFAGMYGYAIRNDVRYVLDGFNYATESIFPFAWAHNAMDSIQLKDIHSKFGKIPLASFPVVSPFDYWINYPYIKKMEVISPLNFIAYSKQLALDVLSKEYDWQSYGNKHCESIWTKFFQEYFLPTKFGYDKRRPHFSSMILAGEMTRKEAIEKLKENPYNEASLEQDLRVILKKLCLSEKEWEEIMQAPIKSYKDYKNNEELYQFKKQYLEQFLQ